MKKAVLSLLALVLTITWGIAQTIGINGSVFQATGQFNQNIDRNPAGLSINYTQALGRSQKLHIGGELGVAMYTYDEYMVENHHGEEELMYEEDCFWTAHALAQYSVYRTPMFNMYVEGRVGVTTFFSSKDPLDEDSELESEFSWHGRAFNSGIGGGVKINLSGLFYGNPNDRDLLWLDLAGTMNSGSRSDYRHVSEGAHLTLDDGHYRSLTNYAHFRVGLNFKLGR